MTVTIAAAAALGLGLTHVLSYQVADALRSRQLVRVLDDEEPPPVPASLTHPGLGRLPMKTRAFIDFSVGRMQQGLRALGIASPPANWNRMLRPPRHGQPARLGGGGGGQGAGGDARRRLGR